MEPETASPMNFQVMLVHGPYLEYQVEGLHSCVEPLSSKMGKSRYIIS